VVVQLDGKIYLPESLMEKISKERGRGETRSATDLLRVPFANVNHLIASGKSTVYKNHSYFYLFIYLSMTVFCILGLFYAHLLLDYYNYAIEQRVLTFVYKINGTKAFFLPFHRIFHHRAVRSSMPSALNFQILTGHIMFNGESWELALKNRLLGRGKKQERKAESETVASTAVSTDKWAFPIWEERNYSIMARWSVKYSRFPNPSTRTSCLCQPSLRMRCQRWECSLYFITSET